MRYFTIVWPDKLTCLLFFLFSAPAQAATYYFFSTSLRGLLQHAAGTFANSGKPSTSLIHGQLNAGDVVLFNRGEDGTILRQSQSSQ